MPRSDAASAAAPAAVAGIAGRRGAGVAAAALAIALSAPLAAGDAAAQPEALSLAGRMGDKALVVLGGRSVVLAPGQSQGGVRLLRWQDDAAVLEREGATVLLRVGAAPVALGGAAPGGGGREVVIPAGPGGHFLTQGSINGRSVRLMVDTGATLVALPQSEAARLGIDLRGGRPSVSQTAGGTVPVVLVTLARLRVGEVELANVAAVVTPAPMPYVLLGNSALSRFQMKRENDIMRLELR